MDSQTAPTINRRRMGRLAQELVHSTLGPVRDLSGNGMRVLTRKVPTGPFYVIVGSSEKRMRLLALPCWSRRIGCRRHEVGIRFVDLDEQTTKDLTAIATTNRFRRTM